MDKPTSSDEARYIDTRESYLSRLLMLWIDRVLRYLFLTNAGGAIAVLGFMGASENIRGMLGPKCALSFFVIGLVLLGILSAYQLHHSAELYTQWRRSLQQHLTGRMTWQELVEGDEERSYVMTGYFGYLLGYGSFLCFCTGSAIGLVLFFSS